MLMLVTSIQTACSTCPLADFLHAMETFSEGQYCCINFGLEVGLEASQLAQRSSAP